MIAKIDSIEITALLKRGDIIFREESEKFLVSSISDNHIILIRNGVYTNLKVFPLDDLVRDNWYLETPAPQTKRSAHSKKMD